MKLSLIICTMLLFSSCRSVRVSSQNEPSNDQAAFALVGITHDPQPPVVLRAFQAGTDDNMRLVFDLPKDELEDFWKASPFANQTRKLLRPHRDGAGVLDQPRLPEGPEPEWTDWKKSHQGWYAEGDLPQGRYVRIYVAVDDGKPEYRCYLFWHET